MVDLQMVCPACGTEYGAGVAFCGQDGTKLQPARQPSVGVCEKCGKRYEEAYEYCPDDGGRLIRDEPRTATHETSAAAAGAASQVPYSTAVAKSQAELWATNEWPVQAGIGELLSRGWALFKSDFAKYLLMFILLNVPYLITPYWSLFLFLFPLTEGMMIYGLKRARGVEPQLGDIGRVFSVFLPLLLVRVVGGLLAFVGSLLFIIPGVYLSVAYVLAFPLVLDRGVGFWDALETSRKIITKRWFTVFGLILVLMLINGLGALPLFIGLLITVPFTLCVNVALYEAALGIREGATNPREH